MKLDVRQKIYQIDGKTPFIGAIGVEMTLRSIMCEVLTGPRSTQQAPSIQEHGENFNLALRIQRNDIVELSNLEAAKIEELVERYISLVAWQVIERLEGRDPFGSSEPETAQED